LINETAVQFGERKNYQERMKKDLEQHITRLNREKETNKATETEIQNEERNLIKSRQILQSCDEEAKTSEG
jgi:23S rRNA pseudoU1915 N3-methylase RlmH